MGSVLSFSPRNVASSHKPAATGVTASVIIFPGIRYEHSGTAGQAAVTSGASDKLQEKPAPRH